ncbi:hypothetical protein D3C72_1604480 [compost metagenome]
MHDRRIVRGHQARLDQRPQQGDCAGGVAPGVAHSQGLRNPLSLAGAHLGKAVHPAGIRAVGGTGVDDPDLGIDDGSRRLPRRLIRQAQDRDIAGIDRLGAPLRVLAVGLGQRQQPQIAAPVEPFMDLQAGGALVAVDKYKGLGHDAVRLGFLGGRHSSSIRRPDKKSRIS